MIITNIGSPILQARRNSRIVTRDDVSRAIVEQVKTDAMFGAGKPRFKVSSHVLPKMGNSDFDVLKLIRDTMKDLSYTHPILSRRLNNSREQLRYTPNGPDSEQPKETTDSIVEDDTIVLTETESLDLEASISNPEIFTPTFTESTEPFRKAVVLPSIYKHQGSKLQRKDYTPTPTRHRADLASIDIAEAGKYHYIRAMPHQVKRLSSTAIP